MEISLIERIKMYIHIHSFKLLSLIHLCHLRFLLMFTPRFHKMFSHGNLV